MQYEHGFLLGTVYKEKLNRVPTEGAMHMKALASQFIFWLPVCQWVLLKEIRPRLVRNYRKNVRIS
jgi:hypothetical protein